MTYEPVGWVDGETPVNAEKLGKMDDGIRANNDAINEINTARENGEFKGEDGKSAYEYAQEAGYEGTEETYAKKLAIPIFTPQMYGAKGEGSADDTAAFQNALAENRVVFVPGGTYKLSGELVIRGNCELVLNQDTVLEFTQTSGNCISMEMSASIRGHHSLIKVPYAFAGNVINVETALNQDVTAIAPWSRWDPQWKAGRYITDLNITKHDSKGFCYANQPGDCKGTAIYISADRNGTSANRSTFIWGLDFSGIRIAGAFSYGIRAVNYNETWNHEMWIAAFICNCEIGVSLEDCNNAYISAAIQPRYAEDTSGTKTGVYAKHGIQLIRSTNADLSGSRVWDWNANGTLWSNGGQYQHLGMYGDCHGVIINAFQYYDEPSIDIRDQIYTDTPSNLEKMNILQEPFTRWFRPKENEPYFFDGETDKRLAFQEDLDQCFVVGQTPTFTDALANAIDTDGSIYNGIGYSRNGGTIGGNGSVNTAQAGSYGHTGFIAVHDGSVVHVEGIKLTADGDVRMAMYDSDFNLIENRIQNAANIIPGTSYWFPDYAETETGFTFRVAAYATCSYIRMGLLSKDITSNPMIAVDEELGYIAEGYLADGIKVKAENVVGGTSGGSGVDVTAAVGQTIVVEEVDENEKPTKWKAADYQQRTHWEENSEIVCFDGIINITKLGQEYEISVAPNLSMGVEYSVVVNGEAYSCVPWDYDGTPAIGAPDTGREYDFSEYPFNIYYYDGAHYVTFSGAGEYSLKIVQSSNTVHRIPPKFLPEGIGYSEFKEILSETTVELVQEDEEVPYTVGVIPTDFTLESGKEYTVKYNGVEYVTTCVEIEEGQPYLGNVGAIIEDIPITADPFIILHAEVGWDENDNPILGWIVAALDGSTSVTLSITGEQVRKIPHKFYDAGTFWVDVTKTYDGVYSCSTTYGQVKAALNGGRMVGLRLLEFSDDTNAHGNVHFGMLQSAPYALTLGGYIPVTIYFDTYTSVFIMQCIIGENREPADDAVYTILS